MTTYEEYLRLLSSLPPNLQVIVRQLWEAGHTLNAQELLRLLYFLFGAANAEQIRRIIILLARLGRLSPGVVEEALCLAASGEGASVVAAGGAAAGEGGAAAGAGAAGGAAGATVAGTLATIAAVLAAALAVALAVYTIKTEVKTRIRYPASGLRCGAGPADPREYHLYRRGIGSRTALQRAIDAAAEHCARIGGECPGECQEGTCKPAPTFIRIDPRYRVLWTTAHVWYRCLCQCVVE